MLLSQPEVFINSFKYKNVFWSRVWYTLSFVASTLVLLKTKMNSEHEE